MVEITRTRDRLLTCARDLYMDGGLAGPSMRKVTQLAGVSATAIYRHFDSKEALVTAIVEEGFAVSSRYLWRAFQAGTPRERLRATGNLGVCLGSEGDFEQFYHQALNRLMRGLMPGASEHRSAAVGG